MNLEKKSNSCLSAIEQFIFSHDSFVMQTNFYNCTWIKSIQKLVIRSEQDAAGQYIFSLWFQMKENNTNKVVPLYKSRGELRVWKDFRWLLEYIKKQFNVTDEFNLTVAVIGTNNREGVKDE